MLRTAIDVGSNSVLTTVCRFEDGSWKTVFETSEVTGLGAGIKTTGGLEEEAQTRTLAAIRDGWALGRSQGCDEIGAAGTMALRIAKNADEFIEKAQAQNTPVTVITGEQEAEFGFLAVANDSLFGKEKRITIIDPGGHSTEIATARREGDVWVNEYRESFPIGTLAMLSTTFQSECPSIEERWRACSEIDEVLGMRYLPGKSGAIVTLGATGCNLVSIRLGLKEWDPALVHGANLWFEEISRSVGWLCGMPIEERKRIPGIEPGRAPTLHAGALILERFLFAASCEECAVSVRGWRHAWLEAGLPAT